MIVREYEIIRKLKINHFLSKIEKSTKKDIEITEHTLFRLNEGKRKINQAEILKSVILTEKPLEVWEQRNKNLSLFYKTDNNKILKIIVKLTPKKIYIVTFMILNKWQEANFKNG